MKVYIGIDEAGRGSMLGPLIICGVMMDSENLKKIEEMGVKNPKMGIMDSKKLSYVERQFLKEKIEKMSKKICILEIKASEVDDYVSKGLYNELECKKYVEIINEIDPERVADFIIVDSPEKPANFKKRLKKYGMLDRIIVKNKADENYSIVACASIVAKVIRDEKIKQIYEECGCIFGSGYPTKRVFEYIKQYYKKHKTLPDWVRKTWEPLRQILK